MNNPTDNPTIKKKKETTDNMKGKGKSVVFSSVWPLARARRETGHREGTQRIHHANIPSTEGRREGNGRGENPLGNIEIWESREMS